MSWRTYYNKPNRNARFTCFLMGILFFIAFAGSLYCILSDFAGFVPSGALERLVSFGVNFCLVLSAVSFSFWSYLRKVYNFRTFLSQSGANMLRNLSISLACIWLVSFIVKIATNHMTFAIGVAILAIVTFLLSLLVRAIAVKIDMYRSDFNFDANVLSQLWRMFK